jgi:signal transduction histidine kinase
MHEPHLQQVFQNLVGNAIKYRRAGPTPVVRIWAERQPTCIVLAVSDNGIGIAPQYREAIFELFSAFAQRR